MTQLCSICTKEFKNVKTHLRMSKCGKPVPIMAPLASIMAPLASIMPAAEPIEVPVEVPVEVPMEQPEIEQVDSAPIMPAAEPMEQPIEVAAAPIPECDLESEGESVNLDVQIEFVNRRAIETDSESAATIKSLKQEIADKDRQLDQVTDSKQYRQLSYNKIVQIETIADYTFIDISFDKINGLQGLVQKLLTGPDGKPKMGTEIVSLNAVQLFKDYARIPVDIQNRIVPNSLEFTTKKSYFDYKFDKETSHYGHCQKNYQGIMSKILLENDFKMAQVKPKMVYWDIETYTEQKSANFGLVPKATDPYAHISMICVVMDKTVYVLTLDKYKATRSIIDAKLKQHTGTDEYMVSIKYCKDEITMCWEFLHQLKVLAETQPIIVCGYNATQGRPQCIGEYFKKPKCYDMEFIIAKLKIESRNMIQTRATFDNKTDDQAYSAIAFMPFVYFIDFKSMVQPALKTESRLEKLKNQKLDSILELFGIQQKISVDHSKFNLASNQPDYDMSEYIAYCIYDCVCLGLVVDSQKLFDLKYQLAVDSETPISTIPFMSDAQKITYRLMREYNPDEMFAYSYIKYDNSIDKKIEGAYTKTIEDESLMFKVLHCMASDFTSQYPSNMILLNICSTTLAADDAEDVSEIDINAYTGKDPCIIKFIKYVNKPSKISTLIKKWFFEKEYYKKDHPENGHVKDLTRSNIAKIKINTIYGLLGQSSSPLFKYELASAVTAMGRTLLHGYTDFVQNEIKLPENEKYSVVSCDTDEIIIVKSRGENPSVPFDEGETDSIFAALHKEIYPYMLEKHKLNLDQGDHYQLKMECETPQYIFNKNKKCYLKYEAETGKLKMKGTGSKTTRSKLMDNKIKAFFINCFTDPVDGINDARDRIATFKNDLRHEIDILKQNQGNLSDYCLLHKFTKSANSSGKLTKSGHLEQEHGFKTMYRVVPYNTGSDQIDYQWIEYHSELDLSKLQTSRLVDLLAAPLTCFFNEKVNAYQMDEEELQDYINDYEYILIRYEPSQKTEWVRANQLESIVKASKSQVIHEIIKRTASKLYIDIDIKANNAGFLPTFDIHDICSFINKLYKNSFAIHIAQDNTKSKLSYHLIGDTLFHKKQMAALARIINKQFSLERYGITEPICDLRVYDEGKQLRLPLQAKWSKEFHKMDKSRYLKMVKSQNFSDYIITGHTHQTTNYNPFYTIPIQFNDTQTKAVITDTIQAKLEAGLNIKITKIKKNTCIMTPCPVCSSTESAVTHDRCPQGLYGETIRCFKATKSLCVKAILRKDETPAEEAKRQKVREMMPLDEATIINMKDIIYDINAAKLTFVRSAMGTSKTQCLKRQLAQPEFDNKFIIFVSFRRTFANSVAAELGIVSYLDIEEKGQIHINNEQKRVMIQFDSLHRLNLSEINPREVILVLDEIESILCQCDSFGSKPQVQNSADRMMRLIEESSKVIVLDALLQNNTIKLIKTLADTQNYQIIDNVYKRLDGKAFMIESSRSGEINELALAQIHQLLTEGKKVVVVATSKKFADLVHISARGLQKPGGDRLNIKIYHGEDARVEEHHTENMATIKHRDFKDVNEAWKDVDLLVYTSTLTAGISFNLKRFDTLIGFYQTGTCDVISFIQATQRVRNFNDCNQYIYLNTKIDYNMKPEYQYASFDQYINHKTNAYGVLYEPSRRESLQAWIGLRQNYIKWNKVQLLKTLLQYQGLKIVYVDSFKTKDPVRPDMYAPSDNWTQILQEGDADLHLKIQSAKFLLQPENQQDETLHDRIMISKTMNMLDLTVDEWNAIPPEHKCIAVEYRDTVIKAKMVRDLFRRVSQTDETTDDAQLIDQIVQHTTANLEHNKLQLQLTRNAKSVAEYVSQSIVVLRQFKTLQAKYGEADFDPKTEKLNIQACNYVIGQIGFQYKPKQIKREGIRYKLCNIIVPEFTEIAGIKFPTPQEILDERDKKHREADYANKKTLEAEAKAADKIAKAQARAAKKAAKALPKCKYAQIEQAEADAELEQANEEATEEQIEADAQLEEEAEAQAEARLEAQVNAQVDNPDEEGSSLI